MNKLIKPTALAGAAALIATVTAVALPSNAVKVPTSVTKVSTTCGTCVAPITCGPQEDQCVYDWRNGAMYARQWNGSVWVRLTLVNGN